MKKTVYGLSLSIVLLSLSSTTVSAQCLQNGVPCGQSQTATTGSTTPTQGTLIMGSDGTNSYPVSTDSTGKITTIVSTLPAIPTGTNTIGAISNTGFSVTGTLPAYTSTPTFNLGTLNGAATAAGVATVNTTLGTPFQAGGSIANTSFGISGTLPAYAATPTFNIGTAPALTSNIQGAVTTASPTYTTGTSQPLSLTTAGALRVDTGGSTQAVSGTVTANIGTTNGLALDTSVNGLFKSGQSIGNTTFGATQGGTWNVGLSAGANAVGTVGVTSLPSLTAGTNTIGSTLVARVFEETTTALAASGVFTASSHDSGVTTGPTNYGFFSCFAYANVAGSLIMSGSNNNTTFYPIITQAMVANTPLTTTGRILFRYLRCAVNNSTTAQTTFVLNSQFGD